MLYMYLVCCFGGNRLNLEPNYAYQLYVFWAIQKLRNGQRGEGVDDFVTNRYAYLRGTLN